MVAKAVLFAKQRHDGQFRKFNGEPYCNHPQRVARTIFDVKIDIHKVDELIVAALLHDIVEDTNTTIEEIEQEFGSIVANIVAELTSDMSGIRRMGKTAYLIDKMLNMTSWSLVVKLSDRLDNVSDIAIASEKFRSKYSKETRSIIAELREKRELTRTHIQLIERIETVLTNNGV